MDNYNSKHVVESHKIFDSVPDTDTQERKQEDCESH